MRRRSSALAVALLLAAPGAAQAQRVAPLPVGPEAAEARPSADGRTLTLDRVLRSSRDHAPQVLEALARVRAAEGRRLSVEGAFDTVFNVGGDARPTGYYDGRQIDARVTRPLERFGGGVYGGYRVSGGEYPVYEGRSYTDQLGEFRAGVVLSLLRDRAIDQRRFERLQADGDVELARLERLSVAIGVQARAIEAYNAWVVAGLRLRAFRDLLQLAERRQAGIQGQVERGFRPRVLLIENEQNILRRRGLVTQAEQSLAAAANTLSLYHRDEDGRPVFPNAAQLPDALPEPLRVSADTLRILRQRPELRQAGLRVELLEQRLRLDRNAMLPRLDLAAEASQDVGARGVAGRTLDGFETKLGLTFVMPLQNRTARGRLRQTQAEIDAVEYRAQAQAEQIGAQLRGVEIAIEGASRLAALAADEADRARRMAAAERRRFELGAADFFIVNQREEAAADAEVRALDARFREVVANADLAAASADLGVLGL